MVLRHAFHLLLTFIFACSFFVSGDQFLEVEDIRGVMQQIFSQHYDKKEMTGKVAKQSIRFYIEKFDPEHVYLLDREVSPYLDVKRAELDKIVEQYQNDDFTVFNELNALFQKAIERNREMREELEKDKAALFQKGKKIGKSSRGFARNVQELKRRAQDQMVRYIDEQRARFGDSYVMRYPSLVLERYNHDLSDFENQYLYLDHVGDPLPQQEQENLFALHVLKALAMGIDSQTEVLSPSEALEMRTRLEKGYPGVGVMLQLQSKGGIFVTRLLEEGPAKKSGKVKVNDRILEIDGETLEGLDLDSVQGMLRGKKGTSVNLLLQRKVKEGHVYVDKEIPVTLDRAMVVDDEDRVHVTTEKIANGVIGTIKLNSFYRGPEGISSVKDVQQAINQLDKEKNLRGLILDLRENSGGYLTEAVKVAGLFISNGVIVTAKYNDGQEKIYRDLDTKKVFDGPLVILTSKGTASAAEIVAQALQDYGVAVVVGDKQTFGKGTIQNQTVTSDKGGSFFKVTVGKYYTVSGKTPQERGVSADIVVPSLYTHLDFGDERIEFTRDGDKIPAKYLDSLKGIQSGDKQWYMTYYVPSLQKKQTHWREMIPYLKKNSDHRLTKNKDYQLFLKQTGTAEEIDTLEVDDDEDTASRRPKNYGVGDMQLAEAFHIVQDMVVLHSYKKEIKHAKN